MLTPSERAELQELVNRYEEAKGELLAYLEQIGEEWEEEVRQASDGSPRDIEQMVLPMQRFDLLQQWMDDVETVPIALEDMDGEGE